MKNLVMAFVSGALLVASFADFPRVLALKQLSPQEVDELANRAEAIQYRQSTTLPNTIDTSFRWPPDHILFYSYVNEGGTKVQPRWSSTIQPGAIIPACLFYTENSVILNPCPSIAFTTTGALELRTPLKMVIEK